MKFLTAFTPSCWSALHWQLIFGYWLRSLAHFFSSVNRLFIFIFLCLSVRDWLWASVPHTQQKSLLWEQGTLNAQLCITATASFLTHPQQCSHVHCSDSEKLSFSLKGEWCFNKTPCKTISVASAGDNKLISQEGPGHDVCSEFIYKAQLWFPGC